MTAETARTRLLWMVLGVSILGAVLGGCRTGSSTPSISEVLAAHPEKFAGITDAAAVYRLQIVLSEVSRDRGTPVLKRSTFRSGAEYFYPASAIKLCAAVAAVQAVEAMNDRSGVTEDDGTGGRDKVTLDSALVFHPLFPGETVRDRDPSHVNGGTITLSHELRKLFLVSDNESFNRLYEFVGHRELNESMHRLGLESAVINHRLSVGRSPEENRRTPRIDIRCGERIVTIQERRSDLLLRNRDMPGLLIGNGYMTGGDQLKPEPMDFTSRNGISVVELQDLLVMLAHPDIPINKPTLQLTASHRQFLLRTMSEYPADSTDPHYERKDYPDDWGKFFLPGLLRVGGRSRDELTICNKVGQAYGFTIDNAYIADHRTGREFFLTAVIYTNADGILNDDTYEYDGVAFPFMADLAEAVAKEIWRQ